MYSRTGLGTFDLGADNNGFIFALSLEIRVLYEAQYWEIALLIPVDLYFKYTSLVRNLLKIALLKK